MTFCAIEMRRAATTTYFARRESKVDPSPWVRILIGAWFIDEAGKTAAKLSADGWEARAVELSDEEKSKMTSRECNEAAERVGSLCSCNEETGHYCDWCRYCEEGM